VTLVKRMWAATVSGMIRDGGLSWADWCGNFAIGTVFLAGVFGVLTAIGFGTWVNYSANLAGWAVAMLAVRMLDRRVWRVHLRHAEQRQTDGR
jgi:hypothetical protein